MTEAFQLFLVGMDASAEVFEFVAHEFRPTDINGVLFFEGGEQKIKKQCFDELILLLASVAQPREQSKPTSYTLVV